MARYRTCRKLRAVATLSWHGRKLVLWVPEATLGAVRAHPSKVSRAWLFPRM
eukprot:CAMPEP_0174726400 /NCGR_PEP_ID=MMETSP1094-20130205/47760_1 /TAXON_ID=156173 /ORGANISM="Chrysochromulina brevifilum, Strain UTEX LB 985" /LENGTH=51 /DNA_ID=CAMNT_0015927979 /DNA_START=60 /DNA_END=212 /DNA_ORIENTATION=+